MRKAKYQSPPSTLGSGGDNNTNIQSDRKKQVNTPPKKKAGSKK